jgi:hypothetical protein
MAEEDVTIDRFELNDETAQAILKDPNILSDMMARGGQIAAAAAALGGHYYVDAQHWGARNAVFVTTGDMAARAAEATQRALTRSLDAGR